MSSDFLIIGHRGDSYAYPENTLLAIEKAFENGAKGVEVDVRITRDGHYVLMHDRTVNRTTNGTGYVDNLTLDYLKTLDAGGWKGAQFAGLAKTKVPTLSEVFEYIKDRDVFLFLHTQLNSFDTSNIGDIVSYAENSDVSNKIVFLSEGNSFKVREISKTVNVFPWGASTNRENYRVRLDLSLQYNFTPFGVGTSLTKEMVTSIKQYNLPILISYISSNFKSETLRLLDVGADMFFTDNVSEGVSAFEEESITQIQPSTYVWRRASLLSGATGLSTPFIYSEGITKVKGYFNENGVIKPVKFYARK